MEKFCKDLREHATKIINYGQKNMIPLTKKEGKHHNKQEVCYICKKEFNTDDSDKKHHKLKDHCHYTGKYIGAAHSICNLRYRIPKEIPIAFHIDDIDYRHGNNVFKKFNLKNLGEYHDLYVQSDILLLADVFENMCIKLYGLDPAHFLSLP